MAVEALVMGMVFGNFNGQNLIWGGGGGGFFKVCPLFFFSF